MVVVSLYTYLFMKYECKIVNLVQHSHTYLQIDYA